MNQQPSISKYVKQPLPESSESSVVSGLELLSSGVLISYWTIWDKVRLMKGGQGKHVARFKIKVRTSTSEQPGQARLHAATRNIASIDSTGERRREEKLCSVVMRWGEAVMAAQDWSKHDPRHPGLGAAQLPAWWRVCFVHGDQTKYYRKLYGRKSQVRSLRHGDNLQPDSMTSDADQDSM